MGEGAIKTSELVTYLFLFVFSPFSCFAKVLVSLVASLIMRCTSSGLRVSSLVLQILLLCRLSKFNFDVNKLQFYVRLTSVVWVWRLYEPLTIAYSFLGDEMIYLDPHTTQPFVPIGTKSTEQEKKLTVLTIARRRGHYLSYKWTRP